MAAQKQQTDLNFSRVPKTRGQVDPGKPAATQESLISFGDDVSTVADEVVALEARLAAAEATIASHEARIAALEAP